MMSVIMLLGSFPLTILTVETPASRAFLQASTLGIMPPEIVPSAMRRSTSSRVRESTLEPELLMSSMMPGTSVMVIISLHPTPAATPATMVSAFTLSILPSASLPMG